MLLREQSIGLIIACGLMWMLMKRFKQAGMYSYNGCVEHGGLAVHTYGRFGHTGATPI